MFSRVNEGTWPSAKYCLNKSFSLFLFLNILRLRTLYCLPSIPQFTGILKRSSHFHHLPQTLRESLTVSTSMNQSPIICNQDPPHRAAHVKRSSAAKTCLQFINMSLRFSLKFIFKSTPCFIYLGTLQH